MITDMQGFWKEKGMAKWEIMLTSSEYRYVLFGSRKNCIFRLLTLTSYRIQQNTTSYN